MRVRWCKPFNDSSYLLTKPPQGCAFGIKIGLYFQKIRVPLRAFGFFNAQDGTQKTPITTMSVNNAFPRS